MHCIKKTRREDAIHILQNSTKIHSQSHICIISIHSYSWIDREKEEELLVICNWIPSVKSFSLGTLIRRNKGYRISIVSEFLSHPRDLSTTKRLFSRWTTPTRWSTPPNHHVTVPSYVSSLGGLLHQYRCWRRFLSF